MGQPFYDNEVASGDMSFSEVNWPTALNMISSDLHRKSSLYGLARPYDPQHLYFPLQVAEV